MTSRSCIGVTGARSFCLTHAPDLESRIDCSSLGSRMLRLNFLQLNFIAVEFFAVEYFNIELFAVEIFAVEYFNVEKHSDT